MAEDWEDEDFEVPDFSAKVQPRKAVDEDEEEVIDAASATKPQSSATAKSNTSKTKADELKAKKAQEEELRLANKLLYAQLENLTPEERRLREREIIEQNDAKLAGELFGSATESTNEDSMARGLGSIPIRTKQDHINFALLCVAKVEESTSFNISAYVKEVTEKLKENMTLEGLDDIIKSLTLVRDDKKKTAAAANKTQKKSKKEIQQKVKEYEDMFGGSAQDDSYSAYDHLEDDFM